MYASYIRLRASVEGLEGPQIGDALKVYIGDAGLYRGMYCLEPRISQN